MEDYSDLFIQQLLDMGAEVSKTLNKQVTHVVFKHGRPSTWKKAQKMGVRIVSVNWVARCKESDEHVDEDLFPAKYEESKLKLMKKRTHRCMQPRDIPIKTPENDRRLKNKIEKMMEELIPSSPVVSDTSPFIIDEQSGLVYSPSLKRSDSMAQRLREMRTQREHLSPSEEVPLDCSSTSHCDPLKKRDEREKQNCNKKSIMKIISEQVKRKSSESDTAMAMCNLVCVERNIEVSTLSSKSQQSLRKTTGKKQSTLKSLIYKTRSERKQSPHLNLESENTEISSELSGSPDKPKSSLPKNLANTIHCNSESMQHYKELQTSCKCFYSRKSSSKSCCFTENENVNQNDESIISNPVPKRQYQTSATLNSADFVGVFPGREVVDDEVFEDYYSPANNAFKRRVILFGLTSDAVHMPTFDLEDSNKKKDKRCDKKRKQKNIDIEDMLVNDSGSLDTIEDIPPETHESRPEHFSAREYELPKSSRLEEIKFEPSAKKRRTQTRFNSAVLSGNKHKSKEHPQ